SHGARGRARLFGLRRDTRAHRTVDAPSPCREVRVRMNSKARDLDDRGGIMVLGLFVAPLLVGSMMYLVGLGNVMVHRHSLQQGADARVPPAGVVSARAMNAIAVMNVLMACIMSIILPLRSLLEGYKAAIIFYGSLCGPHNTCACKSLADAKRANMQLEQKA